MSSIGFPCGCKIEYDINDKVINIMYCDSHESYMYNPKLSFEDNARNLEDEIFINYELLEDD